MILEFGKYKGLSLSDSLIPVGYVTWLAMRGSYQSPENRFETKWKVPIVLSIEARREMERRGYKRIDNHYEKGE